MAPFAAKIDQFRPWNVTLLIQDQDQWLRSFLYTPFGGSSLFLFYSSTLSITMSTERRQGRWRQQVV
ncbi:hypothetical protein LINPERHAP1_LOCUS20821 [Linum perenne]